MLKKISLCCLLVVGFGFLLQLTNLLFWHPYTKFVPKQFMHGFHKDYAVQIAQLDFTQLDPIWAQSFHYLGHGKQMIAFESEDKHYVIKFFYPKRPLKKEWYKHSKYWKEYFSFKWIFREQFHKKVRLKKLFLRHKWAFEKMEKESGILFAHLAPSTQISQVISLIDSQGNRHLLDLTHTPFILQEKAILVPEYLASLSKHHAIKEIKEAIAALEQLFVHRIEAGITDRIQTMGNNYGFVEKRPIQIDVGRIHCDENISPEKECERVLNNFHAWLYKQFPECEHL